MNLKNHFRVRDFDQTSSLALLFLRLVMGVGFILHGQGKIQSPFNWMPPGGPIDVPGIFQFFSAIAEFGGGIALILGIIVPLAALGLAINMAVATSFHMFIWKDPFVAKGGASSFEPALVYLALSILFLTFGPGRYSLDAKIFGKKVEKYL